MFFFTTRFAANWVDIFVLFYGGVVFRVN
jgi:hypothetical protein